MTITLRMHGIEHVCPVNRTKLGIYKAAQLLGCIGGRYRLIVQFDESNYFAVQLCHDLTMAFLVDFFQNVEE